MTDCPSTGSQGLIYQTSMPEARALAELVSAMHDLAFVRDLVLRIRSHKEVDLIHHGLFYAALIAYRRAFNRGSFGLSKSDVVAVNAEELHAYLYNLADKLVAHSANPFEQVKVGIVVQNNAVAGIADLQGKLVGLDDAYFERWLILLGRLARRLDEAIKAARTTVQEAAQKLPVSQIQRAQPLRYTVPKSEEAGDRKR